MQTKFLQVLLLTALASAGSLQLAFADEAADSLYLDNGTMKVGVDRAKGASITWLSWKDYPRNCINIYDPGRLIQQSYYSGRSLDRTSEGQSAAWSPWPWNPIQGGGVGSWARVTRFEKLDDTTLSSETIPKLWDMPDEEAAAVLLQTTRFEPGLPNAIVVDNRLNCNRDEGDAWGPATRSPQEVPACYFTRNFDHFASYLGGGAWRREGQEPGPPWGIVRPPLKSVACFNKQGQGVAIFSPTSGDSWNFGPHGTATSHGPDDSPCVHVAPISRVQLGPKSTYEYRYWLVVGEKSQVAAALDALWKKHSDERGKLTNPTSGPTE